MKTFPARVPPHGMTLLELLVVLAILALLAALLLPEIVRPHDGTQHFSCMSNQKQICLGLVMSAGDNDGKFPWQLSTATNGTLELITNGQAASQFQALEPYLKSFVCYLCPSDSGKVAATNYDHFTDLNVSYFVNVDAPTTTATTILTGDRKLVANGNPVRPGLFYYKTTSDLDWARGVHDKGRRTAGILGFADGHAEFVSATNLNAVFGRQGSSRLEVP